MFRGEKVKVWRDEKMEVLRCGVVEILGDKETNEWFQKPHIILGVNIGGMERDKQYLSPI